MCIRDRLFIVLDDLNAEHDRRISDHVLRMHMYKPPGCTGVQRAPAIGGDYADFADDSGNEDEDSDDDANERAARVFQKRTEFTESRLAKGDDPFYTTAFMKKYIVYAKSKEPKLTDEAVSEITMTYVELRKATHLNAKTLPVTPRSLETLIRLATAHAKCRLSDTVTKTDTDVAKELLHFSLWSNTGVQAPVELDNDTDAEVECKEKEKENEEEFADDHNASGDGDHAMDIDAPVSSGLKEMVMEQLSKCEENAVVQVANILETLCQNLPNTTHQDLCNVLEELTKDGVGFLDSETGTFIRL
eukprot:TRINITY_DN2842_c0_g2_i2.p1 TRINITY_DN2842_c0_g2~~TRINITY_DN2842_c0_g2_i2.p1  ORF type:complete len:303 (+),score=68.24 TRINITY_DN2842_c0_g2_i2:35-943(+)